MPTLTFELNGVQPGVRVSLDKVQQVWNQTLFSLEARKETKGLLVSMLFQGPYNQVKLGSSSGSYLGISLIDGVYRLPPLNHDAAVPFWYLHDLLIANSLQFKPTTMAAYSYQLPFKTADQSDMLVAPYRGTQEVLEYGSYFGAIRMGDLYRSLDVKTADGIVLPMRKGTVLERVGGRYAHVSAAMIGMANSWSLGFARNQIIIASEHAGVFGYSVYSAPGISIPSKS